MAARADGFRDLACILRLTNVEEWCTVSAGMDPRPDQHVPVASPALRWGARGLLLCLLGLLALAALAWSKAPVGSPVPITIPTNRGPRLPLLENWREVDTKPDPAGLVLSVTPLVGIAPLSVQISLRLPVPKREDRELELTAWDGGDEDMLAPLFRSTRDVFWQQARLRDAVQGSGLFIVNERQSNQPTFVPLAQTLRATWRLPSGSMMVVGCVWPRATCVLRRVSVS